MSTLQSPPPLSPSPNTAAAIDPERRDGATLPTAKVALGEELPVFCEKCGYALHGLPQTVCDHCTVRQFHCPECGHHQPINTLRPAFQKILGRIRAFFVALAVLFKLNFFGWLLFAWVGMGAVWSYQYDYHQRQMAFRNANAAAVSGRGAPPARVRYSDFMVPRELDLEQMFAFTLFGLGFGAVGRMLLLRWRRGWLVGLTLSALVIPMILIGAWVRRSNAYGGDELPPPPAYTSGDFLISMGSAAVAITLGAAIVWGVWSALAMVFLPKRTARALLDWQAAQSNPGAASLARD